MLRRILNPNIERSAEHQRVLSTRSTSGLESKSKLRTAEKLVIPRRWHIKRAKLSVGSKDKLSKQSNICKLQPVCCTDNVTDTAYDKHE